MKSNYLLPHGYKRIGWMLLVPSLLLGIAWLLYFQDHEFKFFYMSVLALFTDPLYEGNWHFFSRVNNNVLDEIISLIILISSALVAFSKEKMEDEFIAKIRLESLLWATYVNYAVLIFALIFVYDMAFFWIMVINMFTILFFFIGRFNWKIYHLDRAQDEK